MPDLSTVYPRNLPNVVLKWVLLGGLPSRFESATLLKNFIRIVDHTVASYELARQQFEQFVVRQTGSNLAEMFRAQAHMEDCITALDRAVRHGQRMRRSRDFAGSIPRLSVLEKSNAASISDIRNAIEHAEERVLKGKIKPSDTVMLWLDEDALEIETKRLTYEQLSKWLVEIHGLALDLTLVVFKT